MCASCAVTPLVRRLLRRAARQTNSALRVPPPSRQRGDLPNIAKMHVAMGLTASPRAIFPCVLLLALVALLAAGVPSPPLPRPGTPLPRHITSLGGLPPANATLDLAAIYVVSLPAARARRRMLADLASLSGLQLTFLDAVGSASMEVNLTREVLGDWVKGRKDYEIATWWSHFRAWQLAADLPSPSRPSFERRRLSELQKGQVERIGLGEPKVLILEDDVDWELDLRSRLPHLLAAAARRRDEYDPAREVEGPGTIVWSRRSTFRRGRVPLQRGRTTSRGPSSPRACTPTS
ncbi:hypothetical protein DFJ74DRAFT_670716 [Hyaloraphidium curvatum]|nr:hypothetical protein DFJ74DRAFT_670716 [Hyaloraphidium curvatum]